MTTFNTGYATNGKFSSCGDAAIVSLDALYLANSEQLATATALAQRLSMQLVRQAPEQDHLALTDALELVSRDCGRLRLDFVGGALEHRRRFGGGELLVKACGKPLSASAWALDATAGCGRDAFILAIHGWSVRLWERQPLVHALLEDALARARLTGGAWFERMELECQASLVGLELLAAAADRPHLIYLDPMFPHRTKSAKVKKDMQLLQRYVGADTDADALLMPALAATQARVVVKRPDSAPWLAGVKPSYAVASRGHRFDVYQKPKS